MATWGLAPGLNCLWMASYAYQSGSEGQLLKESQWYSGSVFKPLHVSNLPSKESAMEATQTRKGNSGNRKLTVAGFPVPRSSHFLTFPFSLEKTGNDFFALAVA